MLRKAIRYSKFIQLFVLFLGIQMGALMPRYAHASVLSDALSVINSFPALPPFINNFISPLSVGLLQTADTALSNCSDLTSDAGLIACADKLLADPQVAAALEKNNISASKLQKGLEVVQDISSGDWAELLNDVVALATDQSPMEVGCQIISIVAGGFPICDAIKLLIDIGKAAYEAGKAMLNAIEDAACEIYSWFGGSCGGGNANPYREADVLAAYFRSLNATAMILRTAPDPAGWLQYIQKLRSSALSTFGINGQPIPNLITAPSEPSVDLALTKFIGEIGVQWDEYYFKGGPDSGVSQLDKARQIFTKNNAFKVAALQFNAPDEATRETQKTVAINLCQQSDVLGRALANWRYERGKVNPGKLDSLLNTQQFCSVYFNEYGKTTTAAWSYKQEAIKAACTVKPEGTGYGYDSLLCKTYGGHDSCMKIKHHSNSLMFSDNSKNCEIQSAPAGQEFKNTLKSFDPKDRCALQSDGKTVNCSRDSSVAKACEKAIGAYPKPANALIISVTCKLQRDAEYSSLVNQTIAASGQIVTDLTRQALSIADDYNKWQTNPQLKLPVTSLKFDGTVSVSGSDPLVIVVTTPYGSSSPSWITKSVFDMGFPFGKLTPLDNGDAENDGQNRPGVVFQTLPDPARQKLLDLLAEATEMKAKGLLTAPPPLNPTSQQNIAARINPADFMSRTDPIGRLLARGDTASRFTNSELSALAGLTATVSANGTVSYKTSGPLEVAVLQKAQTATQQLGLGGFSIGK